jgi:hypothetical protein
MKASRLMRVAALFVVLVGSSATLVRADYTFKVHNNTQHTIVNLLTSEHGEKASEFDIGDGIAPGQAVTLQWDKSTDNSNCEWAFTAVYDNGTYSEPVIINFCEDDLNLVFDE